MTDNENKNYSNDPKEPWNTPESDLNGPEDQPRETEPDDKITDTQQVGDQDSPQQPAGDNNQDSDSQQNQSQQSQDQQNPYYNNGSYGNNAYGQYQGNPYGSYNNPYGGYQQNQNNRQGQQYWTYQQYGGQYQQQTPPPNRPGRKNTGLKVFLWILGVLVAGSVLGFSIYGVYTSIAQKSGTQSYDSASSTSAPESGGNGTNGAAQGSASSKAEVQGAPSGNGTNPNGSGIVLASQPASDPLSANEVYRNVVQSVVGVETVVSNISTGEQGTDQGTGIVATADGYILTNAHVVNYSRSNKVTVILHDKKEYAAKVVGYDKTSDLAVLKISASNLTPATFGNSDQLEIGDSVVAIGNPGGMSFASSITGGMVSALNRTIENHSDNGMTYIQTDAAINPGNSGGPLVNMYGQVVGVTSNKIVSTGFEGMGFAIPTSQAKNIINDLVAHGYVSGRSRLGISATTITEIQAQLSGLPAGVMIRDINAESDLKKSNVQKGDIITKADGKQITSLDDLYAVLNQHKAGDVISLTIYSQSTGDNGNTRTVKTKLLEDKGETQK